MRQKNLKNFFSDENKEFGPVQIPFFEFFSSISWGLSTSAKDEFRIFDEYKSLIFQISDLSAVTKSPRNKVFWGICTGPNALFLNLKISLA
jgi:hypothetical protein